MNRNTDRMHINAELVVVAEKEIGAILAKLESETIMILEKLSVQDFDVTGIGDDRQQLIRRVVIEMKRQPGTKWSQ